MMRLLRHLPVSTKISNNHYYDVCWKVQQLISESTGDGGIDAYDRKQGR
ncbi:MAG: hypothetical protein PVJ39_08630 [Gammaproteobacteria bacterium]